MASITLKPTIKQHQAWQKLQDNITTDVLYGGAAGGGKSWCGAEWLLINCYLYPGTRWAVGREELKRLRESTLQTIFKVFAHHKIPRSDWKYNAQDHRIEFIDGVAQGSVIMLLDLKYLPSDPFYERYGSLELTGAWIEEAGEVHFAAYDTLKSRVGRHMNDQYGILGKVFITANPKKNWLYQRFYKPWKEGVLPPTRAFIQAFVDDNPYIESQYRKNLVGIADKILKERLLRGNWDYEDDPYALISHDAILDMFGVKTKGEEKYMTVDVARFGKDSTVLTIWKGLTAIKVLKYKNQGLNITTQKVNDVAQNNDIPRSHIIIDEDGIGGGVVDGLRGVRGFVANSKPIERNDGTKENYANLKSQCAFLLAKKVMARQVGLVVEDEEIVALLTEDLEAIKAKDPDAERRIAIEPKDRVKEVLGRSPDYGDTFIMRMLFELDPPTNMYDEELSDEEVANAVNIY